MKVLIIILKWNKKDDLLTIAKKLNIDNIPSKITKKDIYEKILTKM